MSEPEVKVRHKRGDVREDGKVFWQYYKKGTREEWVTPEAADNIRKGAKMPDQLKTDDV